MNIQSKKKEVQKIKIETSNTSNNKIYIEQKKIIKKPDKRQKVKLNS